MVLSSKSLPRFTARSHVGMVRTANEDRLAVNPAEGWALLADGMGGHLAGEFAATMAVELVAASLAGWHAMAEESERRACLTQGINKAHDVIRARALDDPECKGMGTTLVALVFDVDLVYLAHIGDSRAYLFRDGRLRRLTRDHSVLQSWIDSGIMSPEEARGSAYRGVLTQALGVGEIDASAVEVVCREPGDCFLSCSDGLTDMVDDHTIGQVLTQYATDPEHAADVLIDLANRRGGYDNVSLILATPR